MDITVVNFYILPRAALVMLNLFLSVEDDRFSIDGLMRKRLRQPLTTFT